VSSRAIAASTPRRSGFNHTTLDAGEKKHHRPSSIGFLRFRAWPRTIRTDAVAKSMAIAVPTAIK
jgi:hypothetical protein